MARSNLTAKARLKVPEQRLGWDEFLEVNLL